MAGPRVGIRFEGEDYVSPTVKKVQGGISGLGSQAKTSLLTGFGLGAGVSAFNLIGEAAHAAVGFVGDAVSAASDLTETVNKSQVVFGGSAKAIEDWGKTAAMQMGLSENAAIGAAATFGNLFVSLGLAPQKVAPMSQALVKLASDLASFNNIPVEEALQKLQSGIVGQEKPLRELGVAISAASVDTEAFALGFKKVNGAFTEGEKVQARYALIFKQTQTAQGDFARTSDQVANSERILNAELADETANLGMGLKEAWRVVLQVLIHDAIPTFKVLVPGIAAVAVAITAMMIPALIGMAVAAAPLLLALAAIGGAAVLSAQQLDKNAPAFARYGINAGQAADQVTVAAGQIADAGKRGPKQLVDNLNASVPDVAFAASKIGAAIPQATADGMLAAQQVLADPIHQLNQFIKDELSPAEVIARDRGFLMSKALARGLASNDPLIRKKSFEMRDAALAEIKEEGFKKAGIRVGNSWMAGLISGVDAYRADLIREMGKIKAIMMGNSPPKEGPLKELDKGGFNIGRAWLGGLNKGIGGGLSLPKIPGMPGGSGGGMAFAGAASGGGTIHTHVYLNGSQIAEAISAQNYYDQLPVTRLPRG